MRIAVIGSGISGLASAFLLQGHGDVHLFEKAARLGGHSHTVDAIFGDVAILAAGGGADREGEDRKEVLRKHSCVYWAALIARILAAVLVPYYAS